MFQRGFAPAMNSCRLIHIGLLWAFFALLSGCSTPPTTAAGFEASAQKKIAKGDYDGAIADSTQAIALAATDPEAYYCRGCARDAKCDFEGAIADYSKVIELDPTNIGAYNARGLAKEANSDLAGAAADLNKAEELKSQQSSR
jgi:Flp pilus assembly protein TadD